MLVITTLINGLLGRVNPSKQQAFQGLNQFQNFNFSAMVAPWLLESKNQSNENYKTILAVKLLVS